MPSWKRSTTRGSTYDALHTAGVLPSASLTSTYPARTACSRAVRDRGTGSARASTADISTVACQVRKSFADMSSPDTSRR